MHTNGHRNLSQSNESIYEYNQLRGTTAESIKDETISSKMILHGTKEYDCFTEEPSWLWHKNRSLIYEGL